jgi:8-oxo-dGTP pyrophosphatase MutT (NUDIX family)
MKYRREISAGGIVYKKGESILWLITQHSQHKGWSFPKGLIGDKNAGEKMEEAALREVEEEGGIKAKIVSKDPVEVKYKYRFKDFLVDKSVHYFLMEYISGDPMDHDWEVSEAKFLTEDDIKKTLTFKSDQEAFAKILQLFTEKEQFLLK